MCYETHISQTHCAPCCCPLLVQVMNEALPLLRWLLQLLSHPAEAHHLLRPLPASEPRPRGALRPLPAVSAGRLRPQRRGGGCRGRYELRPRGGTLLQHDRLQDRHSQNQPVPVSGEQDDWVSRRRERQRRPELRRSAPGVQHLDQDTSCPRRRGAQRC